MVKKRSGPLLDDHFHMPENNKLTPRLVAGSAIFGIGWGWAGICPGPGLTAFATLKMEFLIFVGCMIVGMWAFEIYNSKK